MSRRTYRQLDMDAEDYIGCAGKTNNTAELSAVPHALYRTYRWRQSNRRRLNLRHNDWTHVCMTMLAGFAELHTTGARARTAGIKLYTGLHGASSD
jgi:hypothetical protein